MNVIFRCRINPCPGRVKQSTLATSPIWPAINLEHMTQHDLNVCKGKDSKW